MFTDRELELLFKRMQQMVEPLENKVQELTAKIEEMSNAKVERPKTSTSRGKRVQQTKADS
jgi:hypothetical protein